MSSVRGFACVRCERLERLEGAVRELVVEVKALAERVAYIDDRATADSPVVEYENECVHCLEGDCVSALPLNEGNHGCRVGCCEVDSEGSDDLVDRILDALVRSRGGDCE